jgi:hypothetical protein
MYFIILICSPVPEENADKKQYERNENQQKQGVVRLSNCDLPQETLEGIIASST